MAEPEKPTPIRLLILNPQIRRHLREILERNGFQPIILSPLNPSGSLIDCEQAVIFIDWEAEVQFGSAIIRKIKTACPSGGIIFLYDREHRSLIREVMDLGVYGCILDPYDEWEVLTMIKHLLTKRQVKSTSDESLANH